MIRAATPASFSVYPIYTQHKIFNYLMRDSFAWIEQLQVWLIPIAVMSFAIIVIALCTGIEKQRMLLFSAAGVNHALEGASNALVKL